MRKRNSFVMSLVYSRATCAFHLKPKYVTSRTCNWCVHTAQCPINVHCVRASNNVDRSWSSPIVHVDAPFQRSIRLHRMSNVHVHGYIDRTIVISFMWTNSLYYWMATSAKNIHKINWNKCTVDCRMQMFFGSIRSEWQNFFSFFPSFPSFSKWKLNLQWSESPLLNQINSSHYSHAFINRDRTMRQAKAFRSNVLIAALQTRKQAESAWSLESWSILLAACSLSARVSESATFCRMMFILFELLKTII